MWRNYVCKGKGFYSLVMSWIFMAILCSPCYGKDKVNLGLVGRWGYSGEVNCVEIIPNNTPEISDVRYAYCGTSTGLLIIDVTDSKNLKEVGFLNIGEVKDIAFYNSNSGSGNYVVLATGRNGLDILDISNPDGPVYAGGYVTGGAAIDVAISDHYAYVADGYNGLVIIDIQDPSGPVYVGGYETKGNAYGVAISGHYAYVAVYKGLLIIDIQNPSGPVYVGGYETRGTAEDVAISGHYAYVADIYKGLLIIDIQNPSGPVYVGGYETRGTAEDVAISGHYAYVADVFNGLVIIDIQDPGEPVYVGGYETKGNAYGVAISDHYAYVADGSNGLVIIDIQNPGGPAYPGGYDTAEGALGVAISDHYAYVADGNNGLVIIDIQDPTKHGYAGGYDTEGDALGVAISGNYAYVADGDNGLVIIDIQDPSKPVYAGGYNTGYTRGVAISGHYVYVADYGNGLVIIDIRNPSDPVYVGGYDTGGWACGVAISGHYVYVADYGNGLVIIDIQNPSDPVYVGGYDTAGGAFGVAISDHYAYVADVFNGLVIIDIQDPSKPVYAGGYDTGGHAFGVAISGHYAYVAYGFKGLVIIDIQDPGGPVYVGGYETEGYACGVAVNVHYAYVADDNGLVIIDIQNPGGPVYVGGYDSGGYTRGSAKSVAIIDHYAYVADGNKGLVIIDIQDPGGPVYVGGYETEGYAYGVAISGHYAYVADGNNGLVIIDIQDPTKPVYAGGYDTAGSAKSVAIIDHYAYVTDENNGLVVIDIQDPGGTVYVGGYETEGYAYGVAISGNYAYVADGNKCLVIIDIQDPSKPVYAGGYDTEGYAYGVAISGNYAYVANGDNGFLIFQIIETPPPQGNLILCPSGPACVSNPLWSPSQALSDIAYSTFMDQNYPQYFTYYLNPDPKTLTKTISLPLVVDDFDPTLADISDSLTDWAYNRINTGPLYLYLTGLGTQDAFQIMPGEILKASDSLHSDNPDTLKYSLDSFQSGTNWERDTICLLEFSSSGSFCDDLIDGNTPAYNRTIITCTDSDSSYLDQGGDLAFTGQLLNLLQDSNQQDLHLQDLTQDDQLSGLFSDTGITHKERVHLLQSLFSRARDNFWSSGYPFNTQPPQMVTAQGSHTLCSILLSMDQGKSTILDPNKPLISEQSQVIFLKATGHFLDGDGDLTSQVFFQSSDESILQVTQAGEVFVNPLTTYNGKATILATIIDPDFTQSQNHNHDLPHLGGVTGRITITVDVPQREEKGGLPLAIIVAGEKEKGDYLWPEIHTITHYAYCTLLVRGYSRKRITYLTHLKDELFLDDDPVNDHKTDLDGDGDPNNDIDAIPSLASLKGALDRVKEKGTDNLILFLASHGIEDETGDKIEDASSLSSCGFYLSSPDQGSHHVLTPQILDLWLDDLQAYNQNLTITVIIESCHSGLFMTPLLPSGDQKRIIMTSTEEGESYLYAHGLVSFSYYLFTHLQSGASFEKAFDNARQSVLEIDNFLFLNRQFLNEPKQRPKLSDREGARSCSLGGSFLISQDQPVITSATVFPDPNTIPIGEEITLQVRASDLDGIDPNGVWALVNATYSPPVFSGDIDSPIIDLPRIDLFLTESGCMRENIPAFVMQGHTLSLFLLRIKKELFLFPALYPLMSQGMSKTGPFLSQAMLHPLLFLPLFPMPGGFF